MWLIVVKNLSILVTSLYLHLHSLESRMASTDTSSMK